MTFLCADVGCRANCSGRLSPRNGPGKSPLSAVARFFLGGSKEGVMAQTDLFTLPHKPWNAGRLVGAKAPLKPKHIWGRRQQLRSTGRIRDLAMFNCALDAKLRGCDLVKLRLGDVVQGCGSASKSDPIERRPRWLNSLYNNTLALMLTGVCRDPVSPRDIKLIQYVISYRVGSRLERRSTGHDREIPVLEVLTVSKRGDVQVADGWRTEAGD